MCASPCVNVGHPRAPGEHVERWLATSGASFIRLAPFGCWEKVNRSTLDADISITLDVSLMPAARANFTDMPNRTVFYLMLCGEDEWEQIVDARPSCGTASTQWSPLHQLPSCSVVKSGRK